MPGLIRLTLICGSAAFLLVLLYIFTNFLFIAFFLICMMPSLLLIYFILIY